ncbi:unnamed protein product [Onchocerca flexuosa]|uniref:Secreted protein n=1 Tax=Onchocerca flexuosa TaxID=387005 RepID=A0A183I6A8_9BILA|nr:unnamed protein product [Onchocerca flexuosa]
MLRWGTIVPVLSRDKSHSEVIDLNDLLMLMVVGRWPNGYGGYGGPLIVLIPVGGAAGQKEMLRNQWLHISLLLLPMSMSWMKPQRNDHSQLQHFIHILTKS